VICLPNEEIFAGLARMRYEKPSAKLTFYKEFFSAQCQRFNFSKYIFDSLVRNVASSSKFYMVGKGFSGVETPLFESMLVVKDVAEDAEAHVPAQGDDVQDPAAEEVAIDVVSPIPTSPSPSSLGRIIVDMDQDEGIELVTDHEKDVEVEGRHADKQAKIYNIDLDHSSKVLSMQEDYTKVQEAVEIVTIVKLITEVVNAAATQDQIEMDAEYARKL
nr:hypothetical protein [Tanacetum cinerariifolium]